MINEQHGIYMFTIIKDKSYNILFIYKKCDHNQLSVSLPISYNKNNGDYIIAYFEDGTDFIGQTT